MNIVKYFLAALLVNVWSSFAFGQNTAPRIHVPGASSSGQWRQIGRDIDGEAEGDQAGGAVAISEDGLTVMVGAPYNDGNGDDSGHVRIYDRAVGSAELMEITGLGEEVYEFRHMSPELVEQMQEPGGEVLCSLQMEVSGREWLMLTVE